MKFHKSDLNTLDLELNQDIVSNVSASKKSTQVIIGFAAETESDLKNLLAAGKSKLSAKGVDLLYVNDVSHGQVFGSDETSGFLIARDGNVIDVPNISKDTLSEILLDQLSIALG